MRALAFALAATLIASCSFLLPFDFEGLKCDDNGGCLTDAGKTYVCIENKCVSVDAGVMATDAGVDSGTPMDAGTGDAGMTDAGTRADGGTDGGM